jgi:hypothetical protein
MLGLMPKLSETKLHRVNESTEWILLVALHRLSEEWVQKWQELVTQCSLRMLHKSARVLSNVVAVDELCQHCIDKRP